MSASFREQAAIALMVVEASDPEVARVDEAPLAVSRAQSLADEVCAAWGHDVYPSTGTCYRCGKRKATDAAPEYTYR